MVTEFNGFTQGIIGKKLPADTTLKNMKKSELIELLHTAQHNYDTLMWFYTNATNVNMDKWKEQKSHDKEIRDKVIEEFVKELCKASENIRPVGWLIRQEIVSIKRVLEIAEQMKGAGE